MRLPEAKRRRLDTVTETQPWGEEEDDDDEWCCEMTLPDNETDQEGGALFEFTLTHGDMPRRWKNVVNKTRHTARLHQRRDVNLSDHLGGVLTEALRKALLEATASESSLKDADKMHFTMHASDFSAGSNHCFQSTQFDIGEVRQSSQRFEMYLQQLAKQLNSSQSFAPGDDFDLDVTVIRMPTTGSKPKKYDPVKAGLRNIVKRCRIVMKNTEDNMCCARAIVTMRAYADEKARVFPETSYRTLQKGHAPQKLLAQRLLREAGVSEGPCGVEELRLLQAVMPEYQIKVLCIDKPHMIVFAGPPQPRKILLLLEADHYDGCTSYAAWLNTGYYCHECDRGFSTDDIEHHPCEGRRCRSCREFECVDYLQCKSGRALGEHPRPQLFCMECKRHFYGADCYRRHAERVGGKKSVCQRWRKCGDCCKTYEVKYGEKKQRKGHGHKCGWTKCSHCKEYVFLQDHQCFIQRLDETMDDASPKKVPLASVGTRAIVSVTSEGLVEVEREPPVLVYADYEAMTDEQGYQTAILIGYETADSDECHTHYGPSCTDAFISDMETLAVDNEGEDRSVIILFHNMKGYDGMFLLQYMYAHKREVVNMVTVGVKVLSFASDRLTFKDSLCFLPCPLWSFPATFGIEELTKGFFPHLFNTSENQSYEGPLPEVAFYDPDGMSLKKREEFMEWHRGRSVAGYVFNLKRDMESYCVSDVKLLKAGCEKFVEEFEDEADFNPLVKCVTIASACNRYWRKKHVPRREVALQPVNGWRGCQSDQSQKARHWLTWHARRLGDETRIRHVDNGGEVRLSGMLVYGYDATTRTAYEFNGCFYHGCPRCFPRQRYKVSVRRGDRTFQECYEATKAKKAKLEAEGYAVVTQWECDWDRRVKTEPTLTAFVAQQKSERVDPLQPRDAFFGGRTNAVRLHHRVEREGETIRYQDVTSLYPCVNKYEEYPTGHPTILRDIEGVDMSPYFGLCKITVVAPRGLFHPVLPYRHGGKLVFPLCKSCVETEMEKSLWERSATCHHDESQRAMTGTWCTPEVKEAVSCGYRIIRIHEVWQFPTNQRKHRLFATYVDTWLRLKTESSGYPRWATTNEEKRRYVTNYKEREGITLQPEQIRKNPGRKATAKLMLNSFWGKFGENLRKSSTASITTPAELYDLVSNPLHEITNLRICSEKVLEVVYSTHGVECVENGKTNLFVASFTTCHARLKLYSYLKRLGKQVLYFDTDSVIYSHVPGEEELDNGGYLGDLTDELDAGQHIVDFTSGGPKNYGYRTSDGKTECKVRGFSLHTTRGSAQLNYEVLRRNVLEEVTEPRGERRIVDVVNPHFFTRDAATKQLRIQPRTKQYGLVFDKRVVDPDTFLSYPYGYA